MHDWDISLIEPSDLTWAFRDSTCRWHGPDSYSAALDPTPAYQHDQDVIAETLDHVITCAPLPWPGTIWLSPHEEISRTNGWSGRSTRYDEETEKWVVDRGVIFFSAKRIPPHPAVTRYLVAHEYGHQANYLIAEQQGVEYTDIAKDYAGMRGLDWNDGKYGAGTWHSSAVEVLACDFRLVVTGVEPDYWPHPGIERPGRDVERWWSDHFAARAAA